MNHPADDTHTEAQKSSIKTDGNYVGLVPVWVCDPRQPLPRDVLIDNDFLFESPENRSEVRLPQQLTEFVTERISQGPL